MIISNEFSTANDFYKIMNISFVHANGMPAPTYNVLFEQLSHSVVAKRQYAHDPQYPLVNGWLNQVDELLAFLSQQSVGEPVVSVGHSFGAVISYMAAAKAPEKFAGLVMLDPPIIPGWYGRMFELCKSTPLINKITPAHVTMLRKREWQLSDDMVAYFAKKTFFKNFEQQAIRDYVDSVTSKQEDVYRLSYAPEIEAQIFRTIPTHLHTLYGKVTVPSLLLTGTHTDVTMPFLRRGFLRKQTNFCHEEVTGGHMFPLEHPKETAQRINKFIAGLKI